MDDEEGLSPERKEYLLNLSLKLFYSSLVLIVTAVPLVTLIFLLGWYKSFIFPLLGLVLGIAVIVAILNFPKDKLITQLSLTFVILALFGLALYLSNLAVKSKAGLQAFSSGLIPFFTTALITIAAVLLIMKISRFKDSEEKEEKHGELLEELLTQEEPESETPREEVPEETAERQTTESITGEEAAAEKESAPSEEAAEEETEGAVT